MKRLILEQSNDESSTSHSGLALTGACINRHSDLGRQVGRLAGSGGQIAEIDIVRSYLGLLCLGKSDFQAITSMRGHKYFQHALGTGRLPSAERMRQRLDEGAAAGLIPLVAPSFRTMLKQLGVKVSGYPGGLAPLDVDVFPQDNSNTRKEGVSRTCPGRQASRPAGGRRAHAGQWCGVSLQAGRAGDPADHGRHGQLLLTVAVTLEGWWTDLDMDPEQVIGLYRDHATSEQFHSEFKTDLDLERLPMSP